MRDRWLRISKVAGVALVLALVAAGGSSPTQAQTQTCPSTALNTNPACPGVNLGTINGDTGAAMVRRVGTTEAVFYIRVREDTNSLKDLVSRFVLKSPAGVDFDLVVRCNSCATMTGVAPNGGIGGTDQVYVKRTDSQFGDNSFTVIVEVQYRSGSSCAQWTLDITGNAAVPTGTTPLSCG